MKGIKIPDSNKAGLIVIKCIIKGISDKKLYATLGKARDYPESDEKNKVIALIEKELDRRKLEY
jgi:hypothetical protein